MTFGPFEPTLRIPGQWADGPWRLTGDCFLELIEQRHQEELYVGGSQLSGKQTGKKPKASAKRKKDTGPALFEDEP